MLFTGQKSWQQEKIWSNQGLPLENVEKALVPSWQKSSGVAALEYSNHRRWRTERQVHPDMSILLSLALKFHLQTKWHRLQHYTTQGKDLKTFVLCFLLSRIS